MDAGWDVVERIGVAVEVVVEEGDHGLVDERAAVAVEEAEVVAVG